MAETKKKFAFGWLIVVGAMLLQAVVFGAASNMHSQFTAYVVEGEGFSLASFSLMFTIGTIVSAVASPFIGKTYGKFPIKLIFGIGVIVSMGGIMLLSIANNYGMFYLGYSLGQVGISAVASLGAPVLINAWFGEQVRGRALGLVFAGGSIGNIVIQSAIVQVLSNPNMGYKFAYFWAGLIAMVVGLIVTFFLVKMPKDKSDIIGANESENKEKSEEIETWGYTLKEVMSIKFYWVYCIGFVFIGLYVAGMAMQFATYLNALKIAPTTIGAVGSVFALASLFGNIAGGSLFDKIGIYKSMAIGGVGIALACLCLIFTPEFVPLAFGFAVLKGCGVYTYMSSPSILAGRMFGNKDFASILAISNIFFAIGVSIGSPIFGLLVDSLGWKAAWMITLVFVVAAYVCILAAIKAFKKLGKEKFGKIVA